MLNSNPPIESIEEVLGDKEVKDLISSRMSYSPPRAYGNEDAGADAKSQVGCEDCAARWNAFTVLFLLQAYGNEDASADV